MTKWQKISLVLLIAGTLASIKFVFFNNFQPPVPIEPTPEQAVQQPEEANEDVSLSYVTVYFIGQNANKEEVYKIVKRHYDSHINGTKFRFSIESLLQGPNAKEKAKGIYSEIPAGTKLLSLTEAPDKVTINLSSDFQQGGGTDSLYKRLYQLIKTSNKNTTLDVYLYIDGKQADVIGGEGIMINQPLTSKSLDE